MLPNGGIEVHIGKRETRRGSLEEERHVVRVFLFSSTARVRHTETEEVAPETHRFLAADCTYRRILYRLVDSTQLRLPWSS